MIKTHQLDEIICLSELMGIPYSLAAMRLGYLTETWEITDWKSTEEWDTMRRLLITRARHLRMRLNS